MENNYLIHYGILKMKWGIRRYQNEDGTLTPEGRERYGVGVKRKKLRNDVKTTSKQGYSNASIANRLKSSTSEVRSLKDEKEITKNTTAGLDAVKNMSNSELERAVTNMTDEELSNYLTRINREQQVRNKVKSAEDLAKEKQQKEFNNRQSDLNDARSIANDTANLARNMKNLSSNKSTKSYINPKDIDKMTDDELRAATVRAQLENNYLTATNQTMQKGKKAIDWDKIATIAGIAATGISIASSVSAIRNRKDQNG